jgi:hypothetical protein
MNFRLTWPNEQLKAVPGHSDRKAGAKCRCMVSAREEDNSLDQRLERVQRKELWNGDGRSKQGENEESSSEGNPHACPAGPGKVFRTHGTAIDELHDSVVPKLRQRD